MVKLSYLDREFDVIYLYIFLMQKLLLFLKKNEKKIRNIDNIYKKNIL